MNVDPWLGLLAGLVAGLGFGIVNGLIVSYLKVNTFIATLASGYVYRGIAMLITSGFLVSVAAVGFTRVGQAEVLGVRISILAFAVVAVVLSLCSPGPDSADTSTPLGAMPRQRECRECA